MFKIWISLCLATILLAESLLPLMEFHELSKLPALAKHYKQHRAENPSLSFADFIELHYQDTQHHEQDPQTHHDLPFSNHNAQHHSCVPVAFFTPQPIKEFCTLIFISEIQVVAYREPATTSFATSIWQPPKSI
jgi:hypothetical protein